MNYPDQNIIRQKAAFFTEYCNLLTEYGYNDDALNADFENIKNVLTQAIEKAQNEIKKLSANPDEPDDYISIVNNSKGGNIAVEPQDLYNKIKGALVARLAGCALGVPVENWPVEHMQKKAEYEGVGFPPQKYWQLADRAWANHCNVKRDAFLESKMDICPSDDDITYTFLNLLIMEKYGKDFTTADVGAYWKEFLPFAYTAEEITLDNLRKGIDPYICGETDNPFTNLIGALIRADAFGYACAGDPHTAAKLGYCDAYLSHRKNGIYGEMLFAAAVAAAFTAPTTIDAIKSGLNEIPQKSMLYKDITWALENLDKVKTYRDARDLVDQRFKGQSCVHTNNNACLVVFALHLGGNNVSEVITNCVAMGLDNDCTAATAGSIVGAHVGFNNIEEKWYKLFNGKVKTYIINNEVFDIDNAVQRFCALNS